MSILKTLLTVESSTLSSTPITLSTNNNNVVTGSSSYGRCLVTESSNHYLTSTEVGAMGDYLYVQSASTNPKHTAIEIYGKDDLVLARLFAGDSGFITVSSESGRIYAKTTYGEAKLDFIIGSKGEELGKSTIIYNIDGEMNWRYFLMDAGTGKPSELKDTGYKISDWYFNSDAIVTDGGYVFYMQNINDDANSRYLLIDKMGNVVPNELPIVDGLFITYPLEGKGYVWIYPNTRAIWTVAVFDGNNIYYHEFPEVYVDGPGSVPNLDYSNSLSAADGSFVVYFRIGDGSTETEVSYLINKDNKYKLSEIDYNIDGYYVENYTYSHGGIHVQLIYTDDGSKYTGFKIFNTNGILLKFVDWGTNAGLDRREMHFYGNGKLFMLFTNQNYLNISYQMFQYNLNTGVLIGEDMNWKHDRNNHSRSNIHARSYNGGSETNSNQQSILIDFYDSSSIVAGWNNTQTGYLDTYVIIDDETTYQFHQFANDSTIYFNDYSINTDKSFIRSYSYSQTDGPSFWYFFLPNGERKTVQVIDNNSLVIGVNWESSRNYVQLHYYINFNTSSDSVYKMYTLDGILKDTLIYSDSSASNDRWGDSFIHTDYDNEQSWWFDVIKGKYTRTPHFVGGWDNVFSGTTPNGLSSEALLLFETSGFIGVLDKGVFLADKNILSMLKNGSFINETRIVKDTIQVVYSKNYSPNHTIAVFDYNLNFLYEVETGGNHIQSNWVDNRIIFWTWNDTNDQKIDYWCPTKLLCHKQITYSGAGQSLTHRQINNASWYYEL